MVGKVNNKMSVAVACLVALIQISSLAATMWTVGDTAGWTNSGVDYTTWASGITFEVGDILSFDFTSEAHTVSEVSKSDYDRCSSSSPISITDISPANIKLTTGAHYYICTIAGHCDAGQKLAITVGSSSSSTPSSPSPSSSTTPSTPTSTTSPSPPPSSSGAVPLFLGSVCY